MSILESLVQIPIAETVLAVDQILARRQGRAEDIIQDVSDDMEATARIIEQLMDEAVKLLASFANPTIVRDKQELEKLVQATNQYLTRRQLLPRLQVIHGRIKGYVGNRYFESSRYQAMRLALTELDRKLGRYMAEIGAQHLISGTGAGQLYRLKNTAEYSLEQGKVDAQAFEDRTESLLRLATETLSRCELKLPGDILVHTGLVRGHALTAAM